MATFKAKRNAAYAGSEFFLCDFNGRDWLTNAYIAEPDTEAPRITNDTKWRYLNDGPKPLLGSIVKPEDHTVALRAGELVPEYGGIRLEGSDKTATIQERYHNYFVARYPGAVYKSGLHKFDPITVWDKTNLVGIIMPLNER